jgi:hypothetical protein
MGGYWCVLASAPRANSVSSAKPRSTISRPSGPCSVSQQPSSSPCASGSATQGRIPVLRVDVISGDREGLCHQCIAPPLDCHGRCEPPHLPGEPVGGLVITPGDIAPRRDSEHELYVAVLSNAIHLAADTGRVITCPFIAGCGLPLLR